jgi:hypothetical protein
MNRVYCTLFDSYYLPRGVMMLRSLVRLGNFNDRIYVFCFDEHTYDVLKELKIDKVFPLSINEFETDELKKIKPTRTKGEYCWTCTAQTILYVIEKLGENECTYLDADLYFYQNPSILIPREHSESVLITEHRYTKRYDQTKTSGRFCVQFVTFKKEAQAMKLLNEWAVQCLEWCYARVEDGKFGDQKYLDLWPNKGPWVKISNHPGAGMAPWNIQQYLSHQLDPVFFHFHGIQWYENELFFLGPYKLASWVRKDFYNHYLKEWKITALELNKNFNTPITKAAKPKNSLKFYVKRLFYRQNFVDAESL